MFQRKPTDNKQLPGEKNKGDAFNAWMDCEKDQGRTIMTISRLNSTSNSVNKMKGYKRRQWWFNEYKREGEDPKVTWQRVEKILEKKTKSGEFLENPEAPDDQYERYYKTFLSMDEVESITKTETSELKHTGEIEKEDM